MNCIERFLAAAVATHFSAPGFCKGVYMTVNVVKIKVGLDFGDFAVVIRFPASKVRTVSINAIKVNFRWIGYFLQFDNICLLFDHVLGAGVCFVPCNCSAAGHLQEEFQGHGAVPTTPPVLEHIWVGLVRPHAEGHQVVCRVQSQDSVSHGFGHLGVSVDYGLVWVCRLKTAFPMGLGTWEFQ